MKESKNEDKKSSLVTWGLNLGIVGIVLSWIPIINTVSFILGMLAICFCIIPLLKNRSSGKAIVAILLGILSVMITISSQDSLGKAIDETSKNFDTMSGKNTEEVLKNIELDISDFEVATNEYGYSKTKLMIKLTNNTTEKKSFKISIEAINEEGTRLDTDSLFATDLAAGQSQVFELFTYIDKDHLEAMKSATFKVIEASMY